MPTSARQHPRSKLICRLGHDRLVNIVWTFFCARMWRRAAEPGEEEQTLSSAYCASRLEMSSGFPLGEGATSTKPESVEM